MCSSVNAYGRCRYGRALVQLSTIKSTTARCEVTHGVGYAVQTVESGAGSVPMLSTVAFSLASCLRELCSGDPSLVRSSCDELLSGLLWG